MKVLTDEEVKLVLAALGVGRVFATPSVDEKLVVLEAKLRAPDPSPSDEQAERVYLTLAELEAALRTLDERRHEYPLLDAEQAAVLERVADTLGRAYDSARTKAAKR